MSQKGYHNYVRHTVPFRGFENLNGIINKGFFLKFQIFPIIHSASGKTKEFQIVNPQAVDLVTYENKLEFALSKIEE